MKTLPKSVFLFFFFVGALAIPLIAFGKSLDCERLPYDAEIPISFASANKSFTGNIQFYNTEVAKTSYITIDAYDIGNKKRHVLKCDSLYVYANNKRFPFTVAEASVIETTDRQTYIITTGNSIQVGDCCKLLHVLRLTKYKNSFRRKSIGFITPDQGKIEARAENNSIHVFIARRIWNPSTEPLMGAHYFKMEEIVLTPNNMKARLVRTRQSNKQYDLSEQDVKIFELENFI